MRLATGRYSVRISKDGKTMTDGYYGYDSRKQAEARAAEWRDIGFEAVVIDKKKK